MRTKDYYVYIMASRHRTLYIGMTNDLARRVLEHKLKRNPGFTEKYNVDQLVYYEHMERVESAIRREKRLKKWPREWKTNLIEAGNPHWRDLAADWYDGEILHP